MRILGLYFLLLLTYQRIEAGPTEIKRAIYYLNDSSQLGSVPNYIDPYQLCGGGCCSSLTITADHLFTYNELDGSQEFPEGTILPFNGLDVVGGTAITHPTPEQFFISKKGRYLITFMGATTNDGADSVSELIDPDFTARIMFYVNGSPIGAPLEITILGAMVVNQVIVPVSAVPANINLRVRNDTLFLSSMQSATLTIIRISPQP